jgi:hypothetical protein
MDFALKRLDMVGIVMACLNYLSLYIFLWYFDHSNMIPCVSMESFSKNHVETGKFPYGFCIILVRYGRYSNGSPKISFFRYFLKIFWPLIGFHVWAWNHLAKIMWKHANFHMDYALYRLDMVGVIMAHLKYLSLDFF